MTISTSLGCTCKWTNGKQRNEWMNGLIKALPQNLPGGTKENHEKSHSG